MYLLADWAARGNGATVVRSGAGISFSHFLTILSPLTPVVHLKRKNTDLEYAHTMELKNEWKEAKRSAYSGRVGASSD